MESSPTPHEGPRPDHALAREVSIAGWFLVYALLLAAAIGPLAMSYHERPDAFRELGAGLAHFFKALTPLAKSDFGELSRRMGEVGRELTAAVSDMSTTDKLLIFAIYLSVCTTLTPLPTSWIVSALAIQQAAIGPDVVTTTVIVATAGAAASTVANLNDYHLFLWLLRSNRVAKIRNVRWYGVAEKWFGRAPFAILMIFNVVLIPVDVPRMLSALYGYGRVPFAAANLLGRFMRYAVIAAVTYMLGSKGWIAPLALMALAVVLALIKVAPMLVRRATP